MGSETEKKAKGVMTTLEELKSMAHGTEIIGLPLLIKTARKCILMGDNQYWQEVVFMDCSGEMTGYILYSMPDEPSDFNKRRATASPLGHWKTDDRIVVIRAEIQDCDERKKEASKLMVFEACSTVPSLTFDQSQTLSAKEWEGVRKEEVKGKIRHWIVCSAIQSNQVQLMQPAHNIQLQASINQWVNFIVGE